MANANVISRAVIMALSFPGSLAFCFDLRFLLCHGCTARAKQCCHPPSCKRMCLRNRALRKPSSSRRGWSHCYHCSHIDYMNQSVRLRMARFGVGMTTANFPCVQSTFGHAVLRGNCESLRRQLIEDSGVDAIRPAQRHQQAIRFGASERWNHHVAGR